MSTIAHSKTCQAAKHTRASLVAMRNELTPNTPMAIPAKRRKLSVIRAELKAMRAELVR